MSKYYLIIFLIIFYILPYPAFAQISGPEKLFSEGRLAIENNCAECYGRTREGLEEGAAKVVEAIDSGYEDKITAYKVLVEAYRTIAIIYAAPNSEEQERYYKKFREVYQEILSLDPTETEIRLYYASSFKDKEKRISEYREILKINPNHFDARFSIGYSLIDSYVDKKRYGETLDPAILEQGIEEIDKAIEVANFDEVKNVESVIVSTLRHFGLVEEAELVAQMVKDRVEELERQ